MERWVGKTAVVTGASAGIGAAICVGLADAGFRVVGLARRPQLVDKLKENVTGKGCIEARQCDVSKLDDVEATFKWIEEKFGGVDVMVNNAGVFFHGNITNVNNDPVAEEDMFKTLDINIKGVISCTRRAANSMIKRGFNGHIITINSIAGHYVPFSSIFNIYPASKYAITALMGGLNNELADYKNKIKTTSISPGLVATELAVNIELPSLQPRDVADSVLYVLSTPPSVNISELTIEPVTGKRL